jgi:hypothetical protein
LRFFPSSRLDKINSIPNGDHSLIVDAPGEFISFESGPYKNPPVKRQIYYSSEEERLSLIKPIKEAVFSARKNGITVFTDGLGLTEKDDAS